MPKGAKKRRRTSASEATWEFLVQQQEKEESRGGKSHHTIFQQEVQEKIAEGHFKPAWPAGTEAAGESITETLASASGSMATCMAQLGYIRFAAAMGAAADVSCQQVQQQFEKALLALEDVDPELEADIASYRAAKRTAVRGSVSATFHSLLQRAALDGLHFALWAWGQRQRRQRGSSGGSTVISHPVKLAEVIAAALLTSCVPGAASVYRILDRAEPAARKAWGVRCQHSGAVSGGDDNTDGAKAGPWLKTQCKLLRLLRARWTEAVCAVACLPSSLSLGSRSDDASPVSLRKARRALLAFQFVGRDCAARWMSFAVPSTAAIKGLAWLASSGGGVVELGAHNGYWAAAISRKALTKPDQALKPQKHGDRPDGIVALDIDPPELQLWGGNKRKSGIGRAIVVEEGTATMLADRSSTGEY